MTSPLFIVALIGIVALVALETVVYWHVVTGGTWRDWPAGRSLMYLLLIIAGGFGFGTLNQFLGQYPARPLVSFALYALFISALIVIRLTIRAEVKRGNKQDQVKTKLPIRGSSRDIAVASENRETDD